MDNEEEFFKSETVSKAAETDYQMERLMNNIKDVKNFKDFADLSGKGIRRIMKQVGHLFVLDWEDANLHRQKEVFKKIEKR